MAHMHLDRDDLALMHALADAAGTAILPHFRALATVDSKRNDRFDPVTVADRAAEAAMRRLIAERRPHDGVIGEEYGPEREDAGRVWILDPIDGTRAFITGLPSWGVLVALAVEGVARIGMMAQPFVDERFWTDGAAAFWRHGETTRRIATRPCPALAEATLLATDPGMFQGDDAARFAALCAKVKAVRYGTDCYGYAMLAAGHADIVVEAGLKTFDIAPFIPMVTAAGGRVTGWSGGPALGGGRVVAVGDPARHAELLTLLGG